jgi:hypothetical protein
LSDAPAETHPVPDVYIVHNPSTDDDGVPAPVLRTEVADAIPKVGVTKVGELENTILAVPVVPATATPLSLMTVPDVPLKSARSLFVLDAGPETLPPPAGVAHVPSALKKVVVPPG